MNELVKLTLGSRLYNLHNEKSDYDVLVLYKRSVAEYLTLQNFTDTLPEVTVNNVNYKFWDVKKFLQLAQKSSWGAFEAMVALEQGRYESLSAESLLLSHYVPSRLFECRSLLYDCYGVNKSSHHRGYMKALRYVAAHFMLQNDVPPVTLCAFDLLDCVTLSAEMRQQVTNVFDAKLNGVKDMPFFAELDSKQWASYPVVSRNFDELLYTIATFYENF